MIAWFARNHLTANLLVVIIVLLGAYSAWKKVPLEVNPEYRFDEVRINVSYRGATPADVERAVVIPIERAIKNLPSIAEIESEANYGTARIIVTANQLTTPEKLIEELRPLIQGITTFPAEVEPPKLEIPNSAKWFDVIKVAITGEMDEADLLKAARRVRDDLTALPGISQAELQGDSPVEISIEADPARLRDYGLTYLDLAEAIRRSSLDLPAGQIQTSEGYLMIRTSGQAFTQEDFSDIVVRNSQGSQVKLSDVARVTDGFEEVRKILRFNGKPCLLVEVLRLNNESALQIAESVKKYVTESKAKFPSGVTLHIWDDSSIELKGRLNSLLSTLLQGCLLVIIVLGLFLRPAIALWVLIGIPISFAGTLWVMPMMGLTLNVMTIFAFIIAVGLIVDDAIVTSENIYSKMSEGMDPEQAAIAGTEEIAMPVTFGSLTTIVSFLPLMFFEGFYGQFASQVPPIIAAILLFSLIEAKLSLPSHLKYLKPLPANPQGFARLQKWIADGLEYLIETHFRRLATFTARHRYASVAFFIAMSLASVALITSGRLGFVSMPNLEKNRLFVNFTMPRTAQVKDTNELVLRCEKAAEQLRKEFTDPATGKSVVLDVLGSAGGWPGMPWVDPRSGFVIMTVIDSADRTTAHPDTRALIKRWKELCGDTSSAQSFYITVDSGRGSRGGGGSGEESLKIQLRGPGSEARDKLADDIANLLRSYEGITSAGNDLGQNRDELIATIRPEGEALGLTQRELARQVRSSFFGEQAQRVQREIDDIRVMVRLPRDQRESLHTLETMRIKIPNGGEAPLTTVADVSFGKARAEIDRSDGMQAVTIWAQAEDKTVDITSIANDAQAKLDALIVDHPTLSWKFTGYIAEHGETKTRLFVGGAAILIALYALLMIPFKSLVQPLFVMVSIPFGVIGALVGHIVMDVTPSFLSAFGILAVSGIVVNNAIVMMDFINQHRANGMSVWDAVIESGVKRFRPILLTSLTTFVGMVPSMLDESLQNQFLRPMAISIAFGVLFSTLITLFLIPSIYLISHSAMLRLTNLWNLLTKKSPTSSFS